MPWRRAPVCPLLSLSLFFLAACAHAPAKLDTVQKEKIFHSVKANESTRQSISGSGHVSWHDEKHNIAAPGALLLEWPDRLRLEVQDPVGGTLALLVINQDNFWWYAQDAANVATGKTKALAQVLHLPLSGHELVSAWMARPDFASYQSELEAEGEGQFVTEREGRKERLVWSGWSLEPELWEVDLKNGQQIRIEYSDYALHNGVNFPGAIRITYSENGVGRNSITWSWEEAQSSVPKNADLFLVPQKNSFGKPVKSF